LLSLLTNSAQGRKRKAGGEVPAGPLNTASLADLNQRVVAFETIEAYQLNSAQLEMLDQLVAEVKPVVLKVADPAASKELSQYRTKLIELCQMLEKGGADESKLDELKGNVDSLAEQAKYEYGTGREPDEAARQAAKGFAATLTAPQIAGSLSLYSDHVTDPTELVIRTAENKKAAKAQNQWPAMRDGTASEVGYLMAGWDAAAAKAVTSRVAAWLDSCPESDDPLPAVQRAAAVEVVKKIVGSADPWLVLRRWMERDLGRLLANPQLQAAVATRLAAD
jgi:hypothetical protein